MPHHWPRHGLSVAGPLHPTHSQHQAQLQSRPHRCAQGHQTRVATQDPGRSHMQACAGAHHMWTTRRDPQWTVSPHTPLPGEEPLCLRSPHCPWHESGRQSSKALRGGCPCRRPWLAGLPLSSPPLLPASALPSRQLVQQQRAKLQREGKSKFLQGPGTPLPHTPTSSCWSPLPHWGGEALGPGPA